MAVIKKVWKILWQNKETYLFKSLLLQFGLTILSRLVLSEVFNLVLVLGQQDNLNKDNYWSFLLNPLALLGLLVYIFLLALLVYGEFSLLVLILQGKLTRQAINRDAIGRGLRRFTKVLGGRQVIYFLGYLLLTIPFSGIFLTSSLVQKLYIPYFITDEWLKTPQTALPLILVGLLALYLNYRLIFTLPLLALGEAENFSACLRTSWQRTRGRLWTMGWQLTCLFLPVFLVVLPLLFLFLLAMAGATSLSLPTWLSAGLLILFAGLTLAVEELVGLGLVAYLLISLDALPFSEKIKKKKRLIRYLLASGLVLLMLGLGRASSNLNRLTYQPYNQEVQTIAHRGAVDKGVENSIEALEDAKRDGADWVEMDVMLTADGDFIVSHDNNLKRLAGLDVTVSESNLSDLVGLPISQGEFSSRLVSFDDYVARAKELGIKLMVEVKPHGAEPDNFAQLVVDKFKNLGITDHKVMSLDLPLMEAIESLAPDLETGYIIPLQIGDLAGEKVDFLLLEDFSYRDRLVWQAAIYQQDLYVWTINREEQVRAYLQSPVKGMITDKLELVQTVKEELSQNTDVFSQLMRILD